MNSIPSLSHLNKALYSNLYLQLHCILCGRLLYFLAEWGQEKVALATCVSVMSHYVPISTQDNEVSDLLSFMETKMKLSYFKNE